METETQDQIYLKIYETQMNRLLLDFATFSLSLYEIFFVKYLF